MLYDLNLVVWYFHLFKDHPQFVVIHKIRSFSIVNKFHFFLYDPMNVGNLISGSSTFSKSNLYMCDFLIHILLKPSLMDFQYNVASMWRECNSTVVGIFSYIALLWGWNEDWPFPVLWPLLSFSHLTCWVQHFSNTTF